MLSAKEARNQADSIHNKRAKEQLEEIEGLILAAVSDVKFTIGYGKALLKPVEAELKSLGYQIQTYSARNEFSTTISW